MREVAAAAEARDLARRREGVPGEGAPRRLSAVGAEVAGARGGRRGLPPPRRRARVGEAWRRRAARAGEGYTDTELARLRRSGALATTPALSPIAADEIVERDGRLLTSPERMLADLARSLPFEQAVAITDQALRRELCTPEGLSRALTRATRRPGVAEKVREDAILAAGLWVVRWTWADLDAFGPVADRLRARFAAV